MSTVVKITCQNGNHWTTGINASFIDAVRYFMGQKFTREDDKGKETVDIVVNIEDVSRGLAVYK